MEKVLTNLASAEVRRASLNGREYLVAPMTLIVPGVLDGSNGPLFYPADEIAKDPSIWNGFPITAYHPTINGSNVSGRDPDVLDKQGIGHVYRAHVGKDGRLHAEGWFDMEATRRVDGRILQALESHQPLELSTGLYTDNEPAPRGSTHNGRIYTYIARNYRPDHLAILPDQKGACSVQEGCGVLVNQEQSVLFNQFCLWLVKNVKRKRIASEEDRDEGTGEKVKWKGGNAKECECGSQDCDECGKTYNAGVNQPRSQVTGTYKRLGAGMGKGETHEAAQRGNLVLTETDHARGKDAALQADLGSNPPNWAVDEDKWERAKEAADKGDYDKESGQYWAVVARIYENMGGTIQSSSNNAANDAGEGKMKLTDKQRTEIVDFLVANGDCWKHQEDRKILNGFADTKLMVLKATAEKLQQQEAVVNAVKQGFRVPDALTLNAMPAFIREKIKGKKKGKEEEGEDEYEENRKPEEGVEDVEDDEFKAIMADMREKGKVSNRRPPTANEWLATAPPDIRRAVQNAMQIEKREREHIVEHLTANLDKETGKVLAMRLLNKPLEELRDLALLIPAHDYMSDRNNRGDLALNFFGAAGGAMNRLAENAQIDVLDLESARSEYDPLIMNSRQGIDMKAQHN